MIKSFACKDTRKLAADESVRQFQSIERAARLKLFYLDSAEALLDLRIPTDNRLEALTGN